MKKKVNTPRKAAAARWAKRLKFLREQPPSDELMSILNRTEKPTRAPQSRNSQEDLEI